MSNKGDALFIALVSNRGLNGMGTGKNPAFWEQFQFFDAYPLDDASR